MLDSNVDDRFIVDQTRVSRQDAVTHILESHYMFEVISDQAGAHVS